MTMKRTIKDLRSFQRVGIVLGPSTKEDLSPTHVSIFCLYILLVYIDFKFIIKLTKIGSVTHSFDIICF